MNTKGASIHPTSSAQEILDRLDSLTNYFIPFHLQNGEQDQYLSRRFHINLSFAIFFIILFFLANRIRLNGLVSVYSITLASAAIAIACVPLLMKYTGSIKACSKSIFLVLSVLIMELTYITGGPFSPSIVFVPAFPLGGILFVSFRFGGFLALLFFFYLIFLYWADQNNVLPLNDIEQSTMAALNIACTIAVAFVFAFLGVSHVYYQEKLNDSLLRASQAKSDFLSGMSHELRTPLNSIMGFSDLLNRGLAGNLNDKQAAYAANIFNSSTHMLALVNDLLDIAKIESGEVDLQIDMVKPGDLIEDCNQMMIDIAAVKKVHLVCKLDSSIQERTAALDSMKFKQIVLNLLSNAIKFSSEKGSVALDAAIVHNDIIVTVRDEGVGIPIELGTKVFDKFYQIQRTDSSKSSGTGLGLPISRHFAEAHGGSLNLLESNVEDKGACFRLVIPLTTGG